MNSIRIIALIKIINIEFKKPTLHLILTIQNFGALISQSQLGTINRRGILSTLLSQSVSRCIPRAAPRYS